MIKGLAPLVLLGILATACDPHTTPTGEAIIIASDLPITSSPTGAGGARAAQQAIEFAIHQQGRIGGFKLGYWSLDDTLGHNANPVRGVGNVERAIAEHRVLGLIGPYTSGVSKEAIPVANAADLAMIGPATTYWCLTRAAPYCDPQPFCAGRSGCTVDFFRIAPPDPIQGRAMARYAAANLPVSRVAAINELEGEGDQHIVEFASEFARTGGQVVLQQDFMAGTTNFTGFLQTAKTRGAQAVYVVGLGTDRICTVRAQMSRLLPEAYFIAADGVMDGGTLCVQDAIDPVHMLATYPDFIPTYSQDPSVKTQVDVYRRDHRKPSDVTYYTFTAYDAARILIDAIGRAIQSNHGAFPTRAQVVSAVAQTRDFKGVTGTYSFDTNGDTVSPPMSLYEARNNDWFFVKQLDASPARS